MQFLTFDGHLQPAVGSVEDGGLISYYYRLLGPGEMQSHGQAAHFAGGQRERQALGAEALRRDAHFILARSQTAEAEVSIRVGSLLRGHAGVHIRYGYICFRHGCARRIGHISLHAAAELRQR